MFREAIFLLCALTSFGCAALLLRAWLASRSRLVLGTLTCFTGLAISNATLAIDVLALESDRLQWRGIPAAAGLAVMVYVMITSEP